MYNRYIPQHDGSYRKNRIQEQPPEKPAVCPSELPKPNPVSRENRSAEGFLRQLLPRGLDTGDLLVIILLLLMAGDCADEKNTALLTLALYLFL